MSVSVQSLGNCAIVQPVYSLLYLLTSIFAVHWVQNIVNLLLNVVAYCNAITCPSPVTGVWLDNTLQSLASNVDPPSVTCLCLMLCVLYLLYSHASCAGPSQLLVPLTMEQTWSSQGDVWTLLWFLLLWYTRWGVYSTLVSVILYILFALLVVLFQHPPSSDTYSTSLLIFMVEVFGAVSPLFG